ncbi:putative endonuclease lcl3, partial [Dispira parvispora]
MWGKPSNADRASTQGSDRVPSQKLSPTQESTDAHPVNSSWWATWGPTGTQPYPLYITLVAATGAIGVAVYRGLRRFPTVDYIPPRWIERHRPLRGYVVRISDSDNFRLYHAPPLWFGKIPPLHR